LGGSPLYLDMAAGLYTRLGLHDRAMPLYRRATQLQPEIDQFRANLAASLVYVGDIEEAVSLYESLIEKYPAHQRNHYELSKLRKATDRSHVDRMIDVLHTGRLPPDKNIFLYYAIGKELEDLEAWHEAFSYYERAGNAITALANYDVGRDVELIDAVIDTCTAEWLGDAQARAATPAGSPEPIFVTGLPRSGTTLAERIISSHSTVESVDETFFVPIALQRVSALASPDGVTPKIVRTAARKDPARVASDYIASVSYKLTGKPRFVEKLPENFTWLGFVAKAFPHARLIILNRNPMDVCFAMYKQSFFRFAYNQADLARYYIAFDRLKAHWREVLGSRLVEIDYELLVSDQETRTRRLLDELDLPFEQACLDFDQNERPSSTASTVQVRSKVHTQSVQRWRHFESELAPLAAALTAAGIDIGA
ncbi:MAG: sulfotransferase, partial [Pseudomonadales bacterium]|nr:sulfotransferase [Pseudomonadales bacterium]